LIDYFWIRHVDYVHKLSDGLSQENIDRLRLETRSCFDFSCEFIKEIAEEIALYNMSDLIEFFNRHRYFLDDVFDEHGDTLWHLAVVRKMFIVIQRLVVFGRLFNYSADKVNNLGYTPLHIVIFLGARDEFFRPKYCALIKILKGAGVDINRRSNFGLTALHLAVLYSLPNFVDALLAFDETEVDIPIESTSLGTEGFSVPISVGDTPMTLATKIGNRQIVRMLSCRSSVVETIGWSCCR
jgi:ankyrin repeat protein